MYLTMNRFPIKPGAEDAFETTWKQSNTYLHEVPGVVSFHLLKGAVKDDVSLYCSHTIWNSEEDFNNWRKSEAFRAAHSNMGKYREIIAGAPQLETFTSVHSINL